MIVALLCSAQFIVVLDLTIVAIALPAMQGDLGLSTTTLSWVITVYPLTFGGCLLAAGRLADTVGRRRAFVTGLCVFGLASLACGLAPGGAALLAARALQGVGGALVAPSALALLTTARPEGRARARALGWWTAAAAGGGASGWVLGGVLSGLFDWRWVFLVNVPLCAGAIALAPRVLTEWRDPSPTRPDLAGAALVTTGLASLVFALTSAQARGPAAGETLGAFAAALGLLAALARVEARANDPLLDRALLRRPGVVEPNLVAAVLTATTSPAMFFCILYAQDVRKLGPIDAGLLFPPFNLSVIAGSLAGPRVVAALGERRAMTAGLLAVATGGLALLAIAPRGAVLPSLLGGFVLLGSGLGVASVASTSRGTAALDGADQGLASGLLTASAQLGAALGVAVIVPLAAARTAALGGDPSAQVAGYELGFVVVAALAAIMALVLGVHSRHAARPSQEAVSPRNRRYHRRHPKRPPRSASLAPSGDPPIDRPAVWQPTERRQRREQSGLTGETAPMADTGGLAAAESAAGRSARERALRAYAEAKRRVVGRTSVGAGSGAPVHGSGAPVHRDHTARLLSRPR